MDLKNKPLTCSNTSPAAVLHQRLLLRGLWPLTLWLALVLLAPLLHLFNSGILLVIKLPQALTLALRCGLSQLEFFQVHTPLSSGQSVLGLLGSGPVLCSRVVYRPQTRPLALTSRLVSTLWFLAVAWILLQFSTPVPPTGGPLVEISPGPIYQPGVPKSDGGKDLLCRSWHRQLRD